MQLGLKICSSRHLGCWPLHLRQGFCFLPITRPSYDFRSLGNLLRNASCNQNSSPKASVPETLDGRDGSRARLVLTYLAAVRLPRFMPHTSSKLPANACGKTSSGRRLARSTKKECKIRTFIRALATRTGAPAVKADPNLGGLGLDCHSTAAIPRSERGSTITQKAPGTKNAQGEQLMVVLDYEGARGDFIGGNFHMKTCEMFPKDKHLFYLAGQLA